MTKTGIQHLESEIHDVRNAESKIVLNSLTCHGLVQFKINAQT